MCLLCSLLCVVVTVTTTVIHMNRLQTLRECVYQSSSRTCTCFAGIMDHRSIDYEATLRFVFAATPNCEVIHSTIYSCLRAMFGLSVVGILVSIFSCMLVYQILSHEKKKRYLAELNSRCRGLYQRPDFSCLSQHSGPWGECGTSQHHLCSQPWQLQGGRCGPGNLYSPTPEVSSVSTMSTVAGSSRGASPGEGQPWRWLQWARKPQSGLQVGEESSIAMTNTLSQAGGLPQSRPPHWRYSHPDTVYGFRPPGPGIQAARELLSSYSVSPDCQNIPDSLSNLLWGPPPPYCPPALPPLVSPPSPSPPSLPPAPRTSRSGLLEPASDTSETSTSHIYEQLGRGRSGSLPSRKVKRPVPVPRVTQQLSALNLCRSEEQRAVQDLEEIRRALAALEQHSTGLRAVTEVPGGGGVAGGVQSSLQALRLPHLPPVVRRTVSSQLLLSSNSSSSGSRTSTSSSGEPTIRTQALPFLSSSIIQTATSQLLSLPPPPRLPPSLSGLVSPQRRLALPPPPSSSLLPALISPTHMYTSSLSPTAQVTAPSLVYLRPEQNIPQRLSSCT